MEGQWARLRDRHADTESHKDLEIDELVAVQGMHNDSIRCIVKTFDNSVAYVPFSKLQTIKQPVLSSHSISVYAISEYTGRDVSELSFPKFALIVREQLVDTNTGRGHLVNDNGDKIGIDANFPMDKVVEPFAEVTPKIRQSFTTDFSDMKLDSKFAVGPYARALYAFAGQYENELSFAEGAIVQLTRKVDEDWLEGSVDGKRGIFPVNYVQIVVNLPGEESSTNNDQKRLSTVEEGIGFAVVRHDFEGRQVDELSVHAGDSVRVIRMVNTDWVQCCDPSTDSQGIVPLAFLEIYLDEDEEDHQSYGQGTQQKTSNIHDQTFSTLNNASFNVPSCVPDWRTSTRTEDDFRVTGSTGGKSQEWATFDDWLTEKKQTAPPVRPPPPKVQPSLENDVVSVTEMFGMVERQAPPRPVMPSSSFGGNGDTAADPELMKEKRASIIEELVNTELQFVTDMNAFIDAVEGSSKFSNKQKAIMRSGCTQMVNLSGSLVQSLLAQQAKEWDEQSIGIVFLELRKPFAQTYGYYFRNIGHITMLIDQASSNAALEDAFSQLLVQMRANGAQVFDVSNAVSRPIQRCTKYPLFLSEIAKATPLHHPDHPKLLEAVKMMSSLGSKMNESKRRKDLVHKYNEDASNSSLGDKLSKLTIHSIKKKSNRFKYRMGSSIGVVKVSRDGEFDKLVCELDAAERRLVRFNYMLVIYRKKILFETRQLIQKKLIQHPQNKVVRSEVGSIDKDQDLELVPFYEMAKTCCTELNTKVRDEIVKALRAIPKKLIKKRNDKLLDYESAKNNKKSDVSSKYKDYDALNVQVKQTLPKVISVLNTVLRDGLDVVNKTDEKMIQDMKTTYEKEQENARNQGNRNRLIVPGVPCFANYFDPNRLRQLHHIVNKMERSSRHRPSERKSAVNRSVSETKERKSLDEQWRTTTNVAAVPAVAASQLSTSSNTSSVTEASAHTSAKRFRAQTSPERRAILAKAEVKGRCSDMYRCCSVWPSSMEMIEANRLSGKQLIVNEGDAVLVVRRDTGAAWLCYNGYYNALLPRDILRPWFDAPTTTNVPTLDTSVPKQNAVVTRPHSTPISQNLIDLDDLFAPSPSTTQPALAPVAVQALVPTPVGVAASVSAISQPFVEQAPKSPDPASLLDDMVKPIDWGSSRTCSDTNIVPDHDRLDPFAPSNTTINTPIYSQPPVTTTNTAFPVTFDESPRKTNAPGNSLPIRPASAIPQTQTTTTTGMTTTAEDPFICMWNQIRNVPLSNLNQRSHSPQPLIPTRPVPEVKPPPVNGVFGATYDVVPPEQISVPPMYVKNNYDVVPGPQTLQQNLYDQPPSSLYSNVPASGLGFQYDVPPAETAAPGKPEIGRLRVMFDFAPVGANQIGVREGEGLGLLQAHDDDGNPEWIWVQKADGTNGYVPAAYCAPV